jgi:hypothetical protein
VRVAIGRSNIDERSETVMPKLCEASAFDIRGCNSLQRILDSMKNYTGKVG